MNYLNQTTPKSPYTAIANTVPVITLDGPSGTGKGTLCHLLADHLGWHFLDSGALYRILAYAAQISHVSLTDSVLLAQLARTLPMQFVLGGVILLNGEDVSEVIRTESCGQAASRVAAFPEVRAALLERQRAFAIPPGLVTDGRDMGTVVFPNAHLKIYLYASAEARAMRRYLQLKEKGNDVSLVSVMDELAQRDARDTERAHSPLKPAVDALLLDTTGLTIVQVFNNVLQLLEQKN